jgi:hypothetical protein
MSKILQVFVFVMLLPIYCSAQLCSNCEYELFINTYSKYWEDPDGDILMSNQISTPDKYGLWTFFEIREDNSRFDLFTRFVYCADESIQRHKTTIKNKILLYPNPAQDEITIEQPFEEFTLLIRDIKGSLIKSLDFSKKNRKSVKIDVSSLEKGAYLLQIISNNEHMNEIFIVQ